MRPWRTKLFLHNHKRLAYIREHRNSSLIFSGWFTLPSPSLSFLHSIVARILFSHKLHKLFGEIISRLLYKDELKLYANDDKDQWGSEGSPACVQNDKKIAENKQDAPLQLKLRLKYFYHSFPINLTISEISKYLKLVIYIYFIPFPDGISCPSIHLILALFKSKTFSVQNLFRHQHWKYTAYQRGNWLWIRLCQKVWGRPPITSCRLFVGGSLTHAHPLFSSESLLVVSCTKHR